MYEKSKYDGIVPIAEHKAHETSKSRARVEARGDTWRGSVDNPVVSAADPDYVHPCHARLQAEAASSAAAKESDAASGNTPYWGYTGNASSRSTSTNALHRLAGLFTGGAPVNRSTTTTRYDKKGHPLAVPFDPATGWAEAHAIRRVGAALCLPYFVLIVVMTRVMVGRSHDKTLFFHDNRGSVAILALLVGPMLCYSLARVLRPYPSEEWNNRTKRHLLAAVATSNGVAVLCAYGSWEVMRGLSFNALLATVLGIVTLAWGVHRSAQVVPEKAMCVAGRCEWHGKAEEHGRWTK